MAPATESIMGSLPLAKAGVGSAVNDTTRQVGGALGVAVLGSVFNSIYTSSVTDGLSGSSLPADAIATAKDSVGGALAVAASIGGAAGSQVAQVARSTPSSTVSSSHRGPERARHADRRRRHPHLAAGPRPWPGRDTAGGRVRGRAPRAPTRPRRGARPSRPPGPRPRPARRLIPSPRDGDRRPGVRAAAKSRGRPGHPACRGRAVRGRRLRRHDRRGRRGPRRCREGHRLSPLPEPRRR